MKLAIFLMYAISTESAIIHRTYFKPELEGYYYPPYLNRRHDYLIVTNDREAENAKGRDLMADIEKKIIHLRSAALLLKYNTINQAVYPSEYNKVAYFVQQPKRLNKERFLELVRINDEIEEKLKSKTSLSFVNNFKTALENFIDQYDRDMLHNDLLPINTLEKTHFNSFAYQNVRRDVRESWDAYKPKQICTKHYEKMFKALIEKKREIEKELRESNPVVYINFSEVIKSYKNHGNTQPTVNYIHLRAIDVDNKIVGIYKTIIEDLAKLFDKFNNYMALYRNKFSVSMALTPFLITCEYLKERRLELNQVYEQRVYDVIRNPNSVNKEVVTRLRRSGMDIVEPLDQTMFPRNILDPSILDSIIPSRRDILKPSFIPNPNLPAPSFTYLVDPRDHPLVQLNKDLEKAVSPRMQQLKRLLVQNGFLKWESFNLDFPEPSPSSTVCNPSGSQSSSACGPENTETLPPKIAKLGDISDYVNRL